jgi:hypothetical protein
MQDPYPPLLVGSHDPPMHAPPEQSALVEHPHTPPVGVDLQASPRSHVVVQLRQFPPVSPQAAFDVPFEQSPPAQQPPLQVAPTVTLHASPHTPARQAWLTGQSAEVTHGPHVPVTVHEPASHGEQAPPVSPQAVDVVPGWQTVPSQQPPLQVRLPVQLEEHVPEDPQALPLEQSSSLTQPHLPLVRHAEPFSPVQMLQLPPLPPHAAGAVPA